MDLYHKLHIRNVRKLCKDGEVVTLSQLQRKICDAFKTIGLGEREITVTDYNVQGILDMPFNDDPGLLDYREVRWPAFFNVRTGFIVYRVDLLADLMKFFSDKWSDLSVFCMISFIVGHERRHTRQPDYLMEDDKAIKAQEVLLSDELTPEEIEENAHVYAECKREKDANKHAFFFTCKNMHYVRPTLMGKVLHNLSIALDLGYLPAVEDVITIDKD